ncbi:hypothetical protein EVAR_29628_1 [Eumeta japonica]|uniref:Uncharacterized protein n=1 Tax=Eumeta variegata TaxID=151549 RepID=A0A4C1W6L7_EUMVA|nr:hypothetical protein EVAR_29628_1 [Eumeta japonica]
MQDQPSTVPTPKTDRVSASANTNNTMTELLSLVWLEFPTVQEHRCVDLVNLRSGIVSEGSTRRFQGHPTRPPPAKNRNKGWHDEESRLRPSRPNAFKRVYTCVDFVKSSKPPTDELNVRRYADRGRQLGAPSKRRHTLHRCHPASAYRPSDCEPWHTKLDLDIVTDRRYCRLVVYIINFFFICEYAATLTAPV